MSGWPRIYYKLLNLPLSILVKASLFRRNRPELGLDTSRPIMYVLPYNSKADLLTLRAQCLAHDLPDPLEPLEIDGAAATLCIYSRHRVSLPITRQKKSR